MDKKKEYNIPEEENRENKVEEPAAEYRNLYAENARKDFEQAWKRGISTEEFRIRLKEKLRLQDGRGI